MSRQIQVLLLPNDIDDLEQKMAQLRPQVISSTLKEPRLVTETALRVQRPGTDDLTVYLAREEDSDAIIIRPSGTGKTWTVDCLRSPVIEFTRCFFDGKRLNKGRLFYDTTWFDPEGLRTEKNKDFLDWAKQVFATTRRICSRDASFKAYVGIHAKEWLDRGGGTIVKV